MNIHAEKTFLKDVDKIKEKTLLTNLQKVIFNLNQINSIPEIPNVKSYRLRIIIIE